MIDLDSLDGINFANDTSETRMLAIQSESDSSSMAYSNANILTCLFITANVGTIFEESSLLELWFQQLKSYLNTIRPQFVAIHCQEVGGKNYESSMKYVTNFTDKIIGDKSLINDYSRIRIFLDENFESLEKFTALGSLYLVHDSVRDVKLYNFKTAQFDSIDGINVHAGGTTKQPTDHLEKIKFPHELFPECRWSRKGFMRTRWLFNNNQPIDLVNIHLFHDASNLIAMKTTPSPYAKNRQKALDFTLRKLSEPFGTCEASNQQQNHLTKVPLFIFGDFNFRLDTNKVVQRITDGAMPIIKKSDDTKEIVQFIYHRNKSDLLNNLIENDTMEGKECIDASITNSDCSKDNINDDGIVMTVGKKLFDCENLDETFRATKNTEWLQELDNELDNFKSKLFEFKISFSPSYPFKEDESGGYSYMKTRCPAWCDRILFNEAGRDIIHCRSLDSSTDVINENKIDLLQSQGDVMYRLMGNSVPMGDHKPVLLFCSLNVSSKTNCCKQNNQGDSLNENDDSTAM